MGIIARGGSNPPSPTTVFTENSAPRKRRYFWWVLIPLLIVLAGLAIGAWGDRSRTVAIGVEDLREQTVVLGRESGTFRDLLLRLPDVSRQELSETTRGVDETLSEVLTFVQELKQEDPPFEGEMVVLELAIDSWRQGVTSFTDSLLMAADEEFALSAADGITRAMLDLRSADRIYGAYLQAMSPPFVPQPVSPWVEVVFLPVDYPIDTATFSLINQASSSTGPLQAEGGLALGQINSDPEWLLDTTGNLVVVATSEITIDAVIENRGNIASNAQTISLDLQSLGDPIDARTLELPPLEPGSKTTATFSSLPVEPGNPYQLSIRVGLVGADIISEEKARTVEFRVNQTLDQDSDGVSTP